MSHILYTKNVISHVPCRHDHDQSFQEKKKHCDSDSCAEGLDYRLEEENKKYKQYLHVLNPTYADWVKVCSNTVQLDKMAVAMAQDYGLDKDAGPPSGTDYNSRVKHCRMKVRSGGYLVPDKITGLENFSGEKVRPETTELMTMALVAKRQYLRNILEAKDFVNAANPDCSGFRDIINYK